MRARIVEHLGGGAALAAATVAALAWANSPWNAAYAAVASDAKRVVNDVLMTVFFYGVGVEIAREIVAGELRDRRTAALPVFAAAGGMVVPALLYGSVNTGRPGGAGWGVPMATDIVFALAVVGLLGARVPPALRLFLLTLAVADDIGAIVVIAVFYADDVRGWSVLLGAGVLAAIALLRRAGVATALPYLVLGVAAWIAVDRSGVHPTIAGVALGLLTPARLAPAIEHRLRPWTALLIVPLFAMVNAGVHLTGATFDGRVVGGVVLGLVAGKTLGITGATWLAVRLGAGPLPPGTTWWQLVGIAALGGIGFTVALFVAELAGLGAGAKLGVLLASVLAAALGTALLSVRPEPAAPGRAP